MGWSMVPTGANGSTRQAQSTSDLKTLPTPHATRWSSSASAIDPVALGMRPMRSTHSSSVGVGEVGLGEVGTEVQHLGTAEGVVLELHHRGGEAHRHPVRDLDERAHEVGRLLPPLPGLVQVPRAGHAEVGAEDGAVGEADEEVLAHRLDVGDLRARRRLADPGAGPRCLEAHERLAGQGGPQPIGHAVDRVALGHPVQCGGKRGRRLTANRCITRESFVTLQFVVSPCAQG